MGGAGVKGRAPWNKALVVAHGSGGQFVLLLTLYPSAARERKGNYLMASTIKDGRWG
jgi:hypothetical protein